MPNPVLHTDVTKVLSADSYVKSRADQFSKRPAVADPNAAGDFVDIVDMITNSALLQYRPAFNQQGILSSLCKSVSISTEGNRTAVSNPQPDIAGVIRDGQQASESFNRFLSRPGMQQKIALWLKFQVSTRNLQDVFWGSNSEAELLGALEAFMAETSKQAHASQTLISQHITSLLGSRPFGYAYDHINTNFWTPEYFYIAYSFWAYIKGIRFARNIASRKDIEEEHDCYVVHWLRKEAAQQVMGEATGELGLDGVRVPWGLLVKHQFDQIHQIQSNIAVAKLHDALVCLRDYSIGRINSHDTVNQRRAFLVEGLRQFYTVMFGGKIISTSAVKELIENSLLSLGNFEFSFGKFVLNCYLNTEAAVNARKSIKMLSSTEDRITAYINQQHMSDIVYR